MRVDGFSQVHGPQGIRPPHHLQGATRAPSGQEGETSGPVDKLDISLAAQDAIRVAESAEERLARVAQIRQQIAAGTYETPDKLNHAVDRLLDEVG